MSFSSLFRKAIAVSAVVSSFAACLPVQAQTMTPVSWNDVVNFKLDMSSLQPVPSGSEEFNTMYCQFGVRGVPRSEVDDFSPGPGYEYYQPTWERKTINTAHGALSLELPSPSSFNQRDYTFPDGRMLQHYSIVSNTQFRFGPFVRFSMMNMATGASCGINREFRLDVEKRSLKEIERIHNENVQANIRSGKLAKANVLKPIRLTIGGKQALILPVEAYDLGVYTYGKLLIEYKKGVVAHLSKETGPAYIGQPAGVPELDLSLFRVAESIR